MSFGLTDFWRVQISKRTKSFKQDTVEKSLLDWKIAGSKMGIPGSERIKCLGKNPVFAKCYRFLAINSAATSSRA